MGVLTGCIYKLGAIKGSSTFLVFQIYVRLSRAQELDTALAVVRCSQMKRSALIILSDVGIGTSPEQLLHASTASRVHAAVVKHSLTSLLHDQIQLPVFAASKQL